MNYTQLKAALHAYVHREDAETTANEDTALELARANLSRWFFPEELSATLNPVAFVAGVAALPADFAAVDVLSTLKYGDFDPMPAREWMRAVMQKQTFGRFTVLGTNLVVDASVDATVAALKYFTQVSVIAGAGTNVVSTKYPDVWLWQAVAEQHRFVQDFDAADAAQERALAIGTEAMTRSKGNNAGGSLRMASR